MNLNINKSEVLIDKILDYYSVDTYTELANKINVSQTNISTWKKRNSVNAIKKKCKELGIYNEIFKDLNTSLNNNIKQENTNDSVIETKINNENNLSKYFTALQSVAIATNKEDELIEDIKELIKKYLG